MPRTIQEILDHAGELAERFEGLEPGDAAETSVAEHLLRRAALARARTERQIVEAVEAARCTPGAGPDLLRADLAGEAVHLATVLHALVPDASQVSSDAGVVVAAARATYSS